MENIDNVRSFLQRVESRQIRVGIIGPFVRMRPSRECREDITRHSKREGCQMPEITGPMIPELLTKSDVAKLLQVSGRQVENLVKNDRIPKPIRVGTHPRWRRGQLMSCLDALANGES